MVIIHFLNGNDSEMQNHYSQKEYRNDVVIEIDQLFYEIYFFTQDSLEYEMRKDGFFSLPGIIILGEINNEKILNAIDYLVEIGYFNAFKGYGSREDFINNRFSDRWYASNASKTTFESVYSQELR